jgi:hypothetical protein
LSANNGAEGLDFTRPNRPACPFECNIQDPLIAALVDTNNDHTVSIGDTVQFGTYPAIPDGSASGTGGNFTILESTVTNVDFAISDAIGVDTALGQVHWNATPDLEGFDTTNSGFTFESVLVDWFQPTQPTHEDRIFTDPTVSGAGRPNTSVDTSGIQAGDQGFLDVKIFTGDDLF